MLGHFGRNGLDYFARGGIVDLGDPNTHSFIVKIWIDRTPGAEQAAAWRGHITHVPSGQRRYLKELGEIERFILPYLQVLGIEMGPLQRAKRWLKRLADI